MKKTKNLWLINFALRFAGRIQYNKVIKASKNCKKASMTTLRGIIDYAKDTEWGKAHNFAEILEAKSDDELLALWQKNVPVTDYEDIRPMVERHKNGEENILFPGKPKMYATTSGTTGQPKWIPITNEYYDNIYNKMTKIWLYCFMRAKPRCFEGTTISIVGKAIEGAAPDGTVYGSVSGVTRRDIPNFVRPIHSAPDAVFAISDYTARYYTIMRIGIEQNVTIIVTANPSTIVEMQNNVREFFDDYVTDIENGTLNKKLKIEPEVRAVIEATLKPNPKRAAELRALKSQHPDILPKHYWPDMQILTTWKAGNTWVYLDKFKGSFPETMIHQEFSYFASECRSGLVLDNDDNTVLFPHYHYFEFISEEDLENPEPKFYQLHELEVGKRYSVYVTTWSGLYRYPMNDLIEVKGKFNTIPKIRLIQKINGIISMTGEKVHESQFLEAVKRAEADTGIKTKFAIGFAELETSTYHFYYEFEEIDLADDKIAEFNKAVDSKLKEVNIEYEAKRDSFRVKDPVPHALQKNSFETYKERCILQGARDGQFKLNLLMQNEDRHAMFKALVRK
ncbi:MAG: GH3 auxin-responsive promoter family protein [Treponema sp.]|nr:GH3 auxin-responsive promoter family protein [Candidatus Treponema equifaecale]